MPQAQSAPQITLEVKRTFAAPREKVFRAWTDAAELSRWFAPSPDFRTVVTELDLTTGGKYQVEMHHKEGKVHVVAGHYVEIVPPEKLSFTWQWEQPEGTVTLVTIEFHETAAATEVVLRHERFASNEDRARHNHGWLGCFDQLEKAL